jgi:hypothetical protein
LTSVVGAVIEAYKLAPRVQHKKKKKESSSRATKERRREKERRAASSSPVALCNNERYELS